MNRQLLRLMQARLVVDLACVHCLPPGQRSVATLARHHLLQREWVDTCASRCGLNPAMAVHPECACQGLVARRARNPRRPKVVADSPILAMRMTSDQHSAAVLQSQATKMIRPYPDRSRTACQSLCGIQDRAPQQRLLWARQLLGWTMNTLLTSLIATTTSSSPSETRPQMALQSLKPAQHSNAAVPGGRV